MVCLWCHTGCAVSAMPVYASPCGLRVVGCCRYQPRPTNTKQPGGERGVCVWEGHSILIPTKQRPIRSSPQSAGLGAHARRLGRHHSSTGTHHSLLFNCITGSRLPPPRPSFPRSPFPVAEYTVTLSDAGCSCSCPDHHFRRHDCKHIKVILAKLHIVEEPEKWAEVRWDTVRTVLGNLGYGSCDAVVGTGDRATGDLIERCKHACWRRGKGLLGWGTSRWPQRRYGCASISRRTRAMGGCGGVKVFLLTSPEARRLTRRLCPCSRQQQSS